VLPAAPGRDRGLPVRPRDVRVQGRQQDFRRREPLEVSLKCDPELAQALRHSYDAIRPGYHLNKRHWNTLTLDGSLSEQMVRDLIEDSYDLVSPAPKPRGRS
jgi:predicted DNA-binding protein (MmcQ/YjbR family)